MKVIESGVEILEQQPGIVGMFKHIEKVARTSYHSENLITDDSYIKFCGMLKSRGHWACFEHGTVYLRIPKFPEHVESVYFKNNPYTQFTEDCGFYYFTTNYREILHYCNQNDKDPEELLNKFWSEPDQNFKCRVTSKWICSRGISHELVRHRVFVHLQSSQRYIAYDIEKNGGEITFIMPQWVYKIQEEVASTVDSLTGESRDYIRDLEGQALWDKLATIDRTIASRDDFWKTCEKEYIWERQNEEATKLKPEDARGVLCNDVMTEVCMTGFLSDYTYEPSNTTEKAGFFFLRCAPDAHPDFRVLAQDLQNQFNKKFNTNENIE